MPDPTPDLLRKRKNCSLEFLSRRSNVKSFSVKNRGRRGDVLPLLLCLLIVVSVVVFGFTKSQELLSIIHMLVGAFLCMVGYSHSVNDPAKTGQ